MSRHLEDLFDKLEEVKVEFMGAKMLDVAVHILCDTMVDSFGTAEVEFLDPKPVTVNAVTVGDALADRLFEVIVKLIGVKLVDVKFKSMVAVNVEKLGDAMVDRVTEKEAEFLCVTLITLEANTPEKSTGILC